MGYGFGVGGRAAGRVVSRSYYRNVIYRGKNVLRDVVDARLDFLGVR